MTFTKPLKRRLLAAGAVLSLAGCMQVIPMMAPTVETEKNISAAFPFESRYVTVNGSKMRYVETGSGTPVVFVHGNPTSSYLWRNVLPVVGKENRAIAVDLIGMGKSDKPDIAYSLDDHIRYFDGFMEAMKLQKVILVVHDWGGPIALDYAMRHQDQVKGIVLMETIVRPMHWSDTNFLMKYMFKNFRDPVEGDELNIKENYFVEKMLPMMAGRKMSDAEMTAYREPYLKESDRKPVARFPREIPIDGEPARNVTRLDNNFELLRKSNIPLLLLKAEPGLIITDDYAAKLKEGLPRMTVKNIGPGLHFVQEDQPTNVGNAVAEWIAELK